MLDTVIYLGKHKLTDQKTSTEPVQEPISKSCTKKFKLKFTDYVTEKFQANFIYTDKDDNTKSKDRTYVPYDASRNTILKERLKLI